MRIICVLLAIASACSSPAPGVCCETDQQCTLLGVSTPRPCKVGQACSAGLTCVAAECATSADCMTADAPVCINKLCVAKCATDTDCLGASGAPFCASDGTCVGCTMDNQCSGDTPFCDMDDRSCRGCEADAECPSGVCIEATATCADATSIVYVSSVGADTGSCAKGSPCGSIGYAMEHLPATNPVIRVTGSSVSAASTISLDQSVVIDSDGTALQSASTPVLELVGGSLNQAGVIIEGVVLQCSGTGAGAVRVSNVGQLRLHGDTIRGCQIDTTGATLTIDDSVVDATSTVTPITCSSGTLTMERSSFTAATTGITAMNCQLQVRRSRFDPAPDSTIDANGGLVAIENNLFVVPSEFTDLMRVRATTAGSTIAFNTIVNTSSVMQSPKAIICDATQRVTSNVIAYNSAIPISQGTGCVVTSSLFDQAAGTVPGNQTADVGTFFKDRTTKDFHLSATSPARGGGEGGIVTVDLEGKPRPQPTGSKPDIGAYEAP